MAQIVKIESKTQLQQLFNSNTVVIIDFYADWCGPCKAIAPMYAKLSEQLTRPNKILFAKVNVDEQQDIARTYGVTSMPTFMIFKNQRVTRTVRGADLRQLSEAVKTIAAEAESADKSSAAAGGESSGTSSGSNWFGANIASGYGDITEAIELKRLDLLNAESTFGNARTLFEKGAPSSLGKGKAKESKDWVESDTDEQLMLFIPFNSTVKIHSLHFTSLPPTAGDDDDEDEIPMRPRQIQFFTNRTHILGFDEAEGITATQTVTIEAKDWDAKTGTAKVDLRYVKFQNVSSLVVFIVDGDGDGEKVRLDRVRLVGESGEKRDMGKLEKIGDEAGE